MIGQGLRSSRQVHVCAACVHACSFSSAITSFPSSCHTVYINTKLKERNRCGSVCLRVCLGSSAPVGLSWVVLARPICLYLLYIGDVPSCIGLPSRRWWCRCLRGPGPRSALACTGRSPAAAGRLQMASCSWPQAWHRGCRLQVRAVAMVPEAAGQAQG